MKLYTVRKEFEASSRVESYFDNPNAAKLDAVERSLLEGWRVFFVTEGHTNIFAAMNGRGVDLLERSQFVD